MKINTKLYWIAAILFILNTSCQDEFDFITDGSVTLSFSVDTLRFDTVFTELGSATRSIKVYNPNERPVRIDRVFLESEDQSSFRLNVNGVPGKSVEQVEIFGKDSIYIFAEVTIDPDAPLSVSPFVIEERIMVQTNDNVQSVNLEAWGQNANYFPSRFNGGVPVVLSCNNNTIIWDDPKPYVIYGAVFIDSCTLNIPAGTQIYVHGGVARNDIFGTFNDGILYMLTNGRLVVEGTQDDPVVFQGDRLESVFAEAPGQWTGIILGPGSRGNSIQNATIKNSIFGVYVDSTASLDIRRSQIYNTSSSGLVGVRASIDASNCLIYNNFANSIQFIHGGDYNFDYCTVASYGVDASAVAMSNFICYDDPLICAQNSVYRLNARFRNSILFGTRRDEIIFSDFTGGSEPSLFNPFFQNCVVKVDELLSQSDSLYAAFFENQCRDCVNGSRDSILFEDPDEDVYLLDSLSIAEELGVPLRFPRPIATDLAGNLRDTQKPDAGCFEKQ
ncbi:MAG: right-handed parallel beta-helix repeat-containing protein [Saprospiraceae bacterium]|nr:right-handed parallel beta-helix repeat-containing protein [Saprospiraceae bacterium]